MKSLVVVVLLSAIFVYAQTETVINNAGATVVELITTNAAGVVQTEILQTVVGSSTSQTISLATRSSATTSNSLLQTTSALTTAQQVGPVGQPASTPVVPGGETPYQYTTTDQNGNPVVTQGIFTPTGPQTVLPVATTTGSVLGYSQWLSIIGTFTSPPNAAHRMSISIATGWFYFIATTLVGLVGGAWLIVF